MKGFKKKINIFTYFVLENTVSKMLWLRASLKIQKSVKQKQQWIEQHKKFQLKDLTTTKKKFYKTNTKLVTESTENNALNELSNR